jgi:DNA-binding CsgD family transcriptional regulator
MHVTESPALLCVSFAQKAFGSTRALMAKGVEMNGTLTSKCVACPYRGRQIYVVGALRFGREMIIDYIDTYTAAKGFQAESLEAIPVSNQGDPLGKKMILIDTRSLTRDNLLHMFTSKAWSDHAHNLMALFNLPREFEIERVALKYGVRGFLYADDRIDNLANGICTINSGVLWISWQMLAKFIQDIDEEWQESDQLSLSEDEIELLRVLATGAANDAIAKEMGICSHIVKTHLQSIYQKITADNRHQLLFWGQKILPKSKDLSAHVRN